MDEKNENKLTNHEKGVKETKDLKATEIKAKPKEELELIIAYTQVVIHTLQHSGTEITPKSIREEVKMFYTKFGNEDVKKLANTIMKEKKEKN